MYDVLKKKVESIAERYAELIEKRISKALGDDITEYEAMSEIENGIKMLGYLITALDRMNRSTNVNIDNIQAKSTD